MGDTAETRRRHNTGDVVAGRYVLERELGEGGMGVVWVARSVALDVTVALKMLRGELAGTDAVERMSREARTAAQLGHPALVRMLDYGTTDDGEPFLVMELLRGEELNAILGRERRLTPARAVGLLLPVIDGLATAHEKGIVHRDIKPENIFIAQDEQGRLQPKVLDFGIAKRGGAPVSRLTQEGAVLGSPQYFSPEQAQGVEEIDFRSDIWAVGVVLYELLTGAQPFNGRNYNALIRSISQDDPQPITELGVPDNHLWMIISRCLSKAPADRWKSLWELGEALASWLFEKGVLVDAASRSLKDDWLSGSVTRVKTLAGGSGPLRDAATAQAEELELPDEIEPPQEIAAPASRERGRSAGFVSTIRRPPGERAFWKQPWAWLALLAFAVVGVLVGIREFSDDDRSATQGQAKAVASAPPSAAVAVVAAPPPTPPLEETTASETQKVAPPPSARASTKKAGSKAPVAPAVREPAPRPADPKTRSGVDTEFGF
jgi:serine/threonine-protein kinase